jgi:acyl carrier protein-related protein
MEITEFIEKFAEAVEIDDASTLGADTMFRDLDEWNSLAGLSVIAMYDEEFGKTLHVPDFKKAQTIEDLYKLAL